jgi:hypothetical protein
MALFASATMHVIRLPQHLGLPKSLKEVRVKHGEIGNPNLPN